MMTCIGQGGVTLPSTGLDVLFSVSSNYSFVHTFTALFCFGLFYCVWVFFPVMRVSNEAHA